MATFEEKCCFCDESFDSFPSFMKHVAGHEEDVGDSTTMRVEGTEYVLLKDYSEREGMYQCPARGCSNRGTLGQIYRHFVHEHKTASTKRKEPPTELTKAKKKRAFASPSSSSSSRLSSSTSPRLSSASTESGNALSSPPPTSSSPSASLAPGHAPSSLNVPSPVTTVKKVSTDAVFADHQTNARVFGFLNTSLSSVYAGCPVHYILTGKCPPDHSQVFYCTNGLVAALDSEYRVFRNSLVAPKYRVCYRCWTPQHEAFVGHGGFKSCNPAYEGYRDWWLGIPYIVWRCKALRIEVFKFLQIDEDSFPDMAAYSVWLMKSPYTSVGDMTGSNRISHLSTVVLAYFLLRQSGKLEIPKGGYALDAEVPIPQLMT